MVALQQSGNCHGISPNLLNMNAKLLKNVTIVNEGASVVTDVLIKDGIIARIDNNIQPTGNCEEINCEGLHLLPGVIDDQVHFREPGLTHKADIASEARAAVAGGT